MSTQSSVKHPQMNGRSTGLTLVELIVVIAIVAVLAMIAVPSYTSMLEKQRLTNAAETLLSDVRWAKSEAIKRNVKVRISFTTTTPWSYTIVADSNNDTTFDETAIRTGSSAEFTGVSISSTGTSITFDPVRGTLVSITGSTVTLSTTNLSAKVVISSLGRARLCDFGGYEACN